MTELFSRAEGKQSILYSICSHVYRMSYYIVHGEDQSPDENVTGRERQRDVEHFKTGHSTKLGKLLFGESFDTI